MENTEVALSDIDYIKTLLIENGEVITDEVTNQKRGVYDDLYYTVKELDNNNEFEMDIYGSTVFHVNYIMNAKTSEVRDFKYIIGNEDILSEVVAMAKLKKI